MGSNPGLVSDISYPNYSTFTLPRNTWSLEVSLGAYGVKLREKVV